MYSSNKNIVMSIQDDMSTGRGTEIAQAFVTIFGKTNWLARKTKNLFLPFTPSEDAVDYFRTYTIIDSLANWLFFPKYGHI